MPIPIVVISLAVDSARLARFAAHMNTNYSVQIAAVGGTTGCVPSKTAQCSKIRGIADTHGALVRRFNFTGPYIVVEDDAWPRPNWQQRIPTRIAHDVTNLSCQPHSCKGAVALMFRNMAVHRALVALWQTEPYNDIDCRLVRIGQHHCGPLLFTHTGNRYRSRNPA